MAAEVTDHLELFLDQLRTNSQLQADFAANPWNAVAPFQLTGHERDAVLTRDCDDLVALGMTNLPPALGCGGGGGGSIWEILDAIRARLSGLLKRGPTRPDIDEPVPPFPPPGPGPIEPPGPGPRPGPDPGP